MVPKNYELKTLTSTEYLLSEKPGIFREFIFILENHADRLLYMLHVIYIIFFIFLNLIFKT